MTRATTTASSADPADLVTSHRPAPEPERPRRPRRWFLTALGACAVVGVVVTGVVLSQPPAAPDSAARPLEVQTSTVARADLTERVRVQGTLAYDNTRALGTEITGVITGLPAAGTVVTPGQELFRVDEVPVILLRGTLPAWRSFASGMTADGDVLQLEQNLADLGFFTATPDKKFTATTTAAVKKWQKSLGVEQTGTLDAGRVVFSPADIRVQSVTAQIGDAAGAEILTVTGTTKQVLAFLDPAQVSIAPVGAVVSVTLPGGGATTGTVAAVGAPVEQEGSTGPTLKSPVTLTLDDPAATESLDNVAVTLVLTQVRATDVLAVPVLALLAQPGGGFAVERVTGTTTDLVPVELGTFADGLVEVTGGDLTAGDEIVVAK